ncbi:rhamnosyl/mannosyltransferase [Desulfonauticus submarinus]|uniref:Rhamnosyl/mannosyltransferase n=1 Tax=Desulfonauticus submarinus TaxID=206665 RepID=A0A1H0BYZ2_9BACT|nr:glycosyltransferase [Desulfonauticus submarinus]SDN50720.1 rhamnosyl/mannosyltransferase [Desulfonauticus submarinus]
MKILQLGKHYPPDIGGIETVLFDIVEGLNAQNIKCDILCSNSTNKYIEEVVNGYSVFRVRSYGKVASTAIAPQMFFKLREIINNYDIIHIHFPDPLANFALMFARHRNKKVVLHWHSDIIKQRYLLKLYLPFQKWMLNRADVIIATTPKYVEESPYLSKYKNKCRVVPIGINSNKLRVDKDFVLKIKKKFNNKKIIFSLGRLVYYKGFEYLIKSAKYLDDSYVVVIGGEGGLRKKLERLIVENGLFKKVFLIGKIPSDKLGSYYKACDLFCLPSIERSEAFGIVQIEAMSFGKPVVATKIKGSGVDWVNQNGVTGYNVPPKSVKKMADAIVTISQNRDKYCEFSKNSKKRFNELFTRDKMINNIIKIYKEIV